MQIFQVIPNGEVHEITSDQPIKELLEQNESYILCDDISRVVYLWKGSGCSVRSKFIGANKLQELRGQVGLNYKSVSMDEDEAADYPEFLSAIESTRTDGFAKEIREENELGFEINSAPVRRPPKALGGSGGSDYNSQIKQDGPLYTGGDDFSVSSAKQEMTKVGLDKIIETIDAEGMPEGYEREMVIMGDTAYSVAEKVQTFLGKKQIEHVLEPISTLPEGVFFAEGYVPRVLVQGKIVVAIEFLKKKE